MFQEETYDPVTIDRELTYAQQLGFNSMRVYLHHLLYYQNPQQFFNVVDNFLNIAASKQIGIGLVLLDSVWNPESYLGTQPEPTPHVHNSGWVQSPGSDILFNTSRHIEVEEYIRETVSHFANDERIDYWDILNEPENTNSISYPESPTKTVYAYELIQKAFVWAFESNPSQPITSGPWLTTFDQPIISDLIRFMLENSDIISFHSYDPIEITSRSVENLKHYQRPIFITEYMARSLGSTFDPHLGYFFGENVSCYSWGFVNGKTQTIYPWDSWSRNYTAPPEVWFHDILNPDGSAFADEEVSYIRSITSQKK